MNKETNNYIKPNMCSLTGAHGKAIIMEIYNSKAPNMDDVKKEADNCMKKIMEIRGNG